MRVCARAAVLSKNSPFKEQYERERKKGMSKTAAYCAYCAIARKLARLCWSLVCVGLSFATMPNMTRTGSTSNQRSSSATNRMSKSPTEPLTTRHRISVASRSSAGQVGSLPAVLRDRRNDVKSLAVYGDEL